jgi:GTP cyclohydrolase I
MSLVNHYEEILKSTGENASDADLKDTPKRAAKAFEDLTSGYQKSLQVITNEALFETQNDEMVIVKNIELYSLCRHHLLPFFGECHIGYLPNGKILGLSKFARIVEMFSRRLQVQENLTFQVANAIQEVTQAKGVGVVIQAKHLCMMMRGVEKQHSSMITSTMLGAFREDSKSRQEFLTLIKNNS